MHKFSDHNKNEDPIPPIGLIGTTGTCKTTSAVELLSATALPAVVVGHNHKALNDYEAANVFHFYGRSVVDPATGKDPKSGKLEPYSCLADLTIIDELRKNRHSIKAEYCQTKCKHGLKFMLSTEGDEKKTADYRSIMNNMGYSDPDKVVPCPYLSHVEEARQSQKLGITAMSFSQYMADFDGEARLIFADENFETGKVVTINVEKVKDWHAGATAGLFKLDEKIRSADNHNRPYDLSERIVHLIAAIKTIKDLQAELEKNGPRRLIPTDLAERVVNIWPFYWQNGSAPWESPIFQKVKVKPEKVPFRIWKDLIAAIEAGSAYISGQSLFVPVMSPLMKTIALNQRSAIIMDATMPAEIRSMIEARGGTIHELTAKQNAWIVRFAQNHHGKGRNDIENDETDGKKKSWMKMRRPRDEADLERAIDLMIQAVRAIPEGRLGRALITHLKFAQFLYDEHKKDPDNSRIKKLTGERIAIGHFGLDDKHHSRWKGKSIVVWGSQLMGTEDQEKQYSLARAAALAAGANIEDWPVWCMQTSQNVWVDEGCGTEVMAGAPLPRNLIIREWLLARNEEAIVQIIGRPRAAWEDKKIHVWIFGGLPVRLTRFGLRVDEYKEDGDVIDTRRVDQKASDKKCQMAVDRLEARGIKPSVRKLADETRQMKAEGLVKEGVNNDAAAAFLRCRRAGVR
jgi:hypothetical protein